MAQGPKPHRQEFVNYRPDYDAAKAGRQFNDPDGAGMQPDPRIAIAQRVYDVLAGHQVRGGGLNEMGFLDPYGIRQQDLDYRQVPPNGNFQGATPNSGLPNARGGTGPIPAGQFPMLSQSRQNRRRTPPPAPAAEQGGWRGWPVIGPLAEALG